MDPPSRDLCCVCLDGYEGEVPSTVLPCCHRMHTACLHQYIQSRPAYVLPTCPICRHILLDPVHPIVPTAHIPIALPSRAAIQGDNTDGYRRQFREGIVYTFIMFIVLLISMLILIGMALSNNNR